MLKNILKIFKELLFEKHKYTLESNEVKTLKKLSNLKRVNNTFFSMQYNNYYKDIIYELKYKKCKYVASIIANIIKKDIDLLFQLEKIDNIIVSPISDKRLKQRGFNQVELILDELNLEYLKINKNKDTLKMSKLTNDYEKRLNILKVFEVKGLNLDNKSVLIVDDIITTGTTVNEIKKQLEKEYSNIKIYIYSIAVSSKYIKKEGVIWKIN
ncbi:ComF family protein [Oceanivirga salmonicida]|uniref:ComF family protein n=1 Tax=Oceanivirga salmonicida TaxID=1769291 RepID=UPI000833F7AA|nr:phosphoribosyltransferase family protein [Oceanivirga salmonicida]